MTSSIIKGRTVTFTLTNKDVKQAVKSCNMSKRYINTMVRASVINILYHRLHIADQEFTTKSFNNVSYKAFRPKSRNPLILAYFTYMTAFKDAMEKNYLKEMFLYFIDPATDDVVENYKFAFKYSREKKSSGNAEAAEDLTLTTTDLLQSLFELGAHAKLQNNVTVKVEFTYFDETPEDYEPPGFASVGLNDALMTKLAKKGNSVIFGILTTGFHTLKCRGRGSIFDCLDVSLDKDETHIDSEDLLQGINKDLLTEDFDDMPVLKPNLKDKDNDNNQDKNKINLDTTYVSQQAISISEDEFEPSEDCVLCKLPTSGKTQLDVIKCTACKEKYHAACQGFLDKTFVGDPFVCMKCRKDHNDLLLSNVTAQDRTAACRLRYLIAYVHKYQCTPKGLGPIFTDSVTKLKNASFFKEIGDKLVARPKGIKQLFDFSNKLLFDEEEP